MGPLERAVEALLRPLKLGALGTEVLKGAAAAFTVKGTGFVGSFLLSLFIARALGAADSGLFFLGLSLLTVAAVLARFGLDNVMVREVARAESVGSFETVRKIGRYGFTFVASVATGVGVILYFLARPLSIAVFNKPGLEPVLEVAAGGVPFLALTIIMSELLRGLRRITFAELLQIGGPVLPVTALIVVSAAGLTTAPGGMTAYVIGAAAALAVGLVLWNAVQAKRQVDLGLPEFSLLRMLRSGGHLFIASIMDLVVSWAGIIFLGIWATKADVGVFSIALRVALLLTGVLKALNSIGAPVIARLYHQGDLAGLESLARKATAVITLLVLPAFFVLAVAAEWVMGWFGSDFTGGAILLIVLGAGQMVNVTTGPVSYILMMTGHERWQMQIVMVSATICVALHLILVPRHGALGAAVATAVTLGVQNVLAAVSVSLMLGIRPVPVVPARHKGSGTVVRR